MSSEFSDSEWFSEHEGERPDVETFESSNKPKKKELAEMDEEELAALKSDVAAVEAQHGKALEVLAHMRELAVGPGEKAYLDEIETALDGDRKTLETWKGRIEAHTENARRKKNTSDRVGGMEIGPSEEAPETLAAEGAEAEHSSLEGVSHDVPPVTTDTASPAESVADPTLDVTPVSVARMETVHTSELPAASNDAPEEAMGEQSIDTSPSIPAESVSHTTPGTPVSEVAVTPEEPTTEGPASLREVVEESAMPAEQSEAETPSPEAEETAAAVEEQEKEIVAEAAKAEETGASAEPAEEFPLQDQLEGQPSVEAAEVLVASGKLNEVAMENFTEQISNTAANDADRMEAANDDAFDALDSEEAAELVESGAEDIVEDAETMGEAVENGEQQHIDPKQWAAALFAQYVLIKSLEGRGRGALNPRELFRRMMEEREKALEAKVKQTETFEELEGVLDDEEIIVNSRGEQPPFYRAEELTDMIEDVRSGDESVEVLPEVSGIREQVGTFLEREDAEEQARQEAEAEEEARLKERQDEQREAEQQAQSLKKAA